VSDNPFRQPLRRRNTNFKTYARQADHRGKDAGGNTDFAIGDDYLWIAFDFSVPLAWIRTVEPLGPGFLIAWDNPIQKSEEWAAFCFLRTGWGYNTKKRDDVMGRVRDAVAKAAHRPLAREVSVAETVPACQTCAAPDPKVFDYTWYTCFLAYAIAKSDRRLLCRPHAATRLRMVSVYNLLLGNLGWGVFVSPVFSYRNIRSAREGGAIEAFEAHAWTLVAAVPWGLLAWLVGWSLWTAFQMW
jgi:hypothetical protein